MVEKKHINHSILIYADKQKKEGKQKMIYYKIDIISALKESEFNTNVIRKEKLLGEGTLQNLRNEKYISFDALNTICALLELQPSDVIGFELDTKEDEKIIKAKERIKDK